MCLKFTCGHATELYEKEMGTIKGLWENSKRLWTWVSSRSMLQRASPLKPWFCTCVSSLHFACLCASKDKGVPETPGHWFRILHVTVFLYTWSCLEYRNTLSLENILHVFLPTLNVQHVNYQICVSFKCIVLDLKKMLFEYTYKKSPEFNEYWEKIFF